MTFAIEVTYASNGNFSLFFCEHICNLTPPSDILTHVDDITRRLVKRALDEDIGSGDATSLALVPASAMAHAAIVARERLTVAGLTLAEMCFSEVDNTVKLKRMAEDGEPLESGSIILQLDGPAQSILSGERTALNFLQRLSGIATITAHYKEAIEGTGAQLMDTRKTTPGWRALEKHAVACGGGKNHRMGLYDMVLIKDNHLAADNAAQGQALAEAVIKAKTAAPDLLVQVEIDRLDQIEPALKAKVDALLLDNFSLNDLKEGSRMIGSLAVTEASGGITLENVSSYKELDLDFISTSALVGRAAWSDVGLDWLS